MLEQMTLDGFELMPDVVLQSTDRYLIARNQETGEVVEISARKDDKGKVRCHVWFNGIPSPIGFDEFEAYIRLVSRL